MGIEKISLSQTRSKEMDTCTVIEYDFPSKELGIAIAEIHGRYPESGNSLNDVCDQAIYVISGTGAVLSQGERLELNEKDAAYIPKNTPYSLEGDHMHIVIANAPAWFVEQYRHIE